MTTFPIDPLELLGKFQAAGLAEDGRRALGLTPERMTSALAALAPAFAVAMKQVAEAPGTVKALADAAGAADGAGIVRALFGGGDVAGKVAEASAAASGVATDTMAALMPLAAAALMAKPEPPPPTPAEQAAQAATAMMRAMVGLEPEPPKPEPKQPTLPDLVRGGYDKLIESVETNRRIAAEHMEGLSRLYEAMLKGGGEPPR